MTSINTKDECPTSQEPTNLENRGNGGTASKDAGRSRSPLFGVWGTGGTQTCF